MKVLIVGGGITGLSAAWFLLKKWPQARITLFEKSDRLGGWIRTSREGDFFFEKGPRTFPFNRSPHLLQLIRELELPILASPPQKRYLYHRGRLRSFGSFLPRLLPYLIREPFIPSSSAPDESIYSFASRRFCPDIAETLFDPLTLGIYGGDIHKLSVRACFPTLYQWEREKGSLLRGFFSSPRTKGPKGLFTVAGGMEKMVEELTKRLALEVLLHSSVEKIEERSVTSEGRTWRADYVLSALPPPVPALSLHVVNLAYEGDLLSQKGYGYLVPSREKSSLLGMIFDSSIFPQQNRGNETRLTAMLRAEEQTPLAAALEAAASHLGIRKKPLYTAAYLAKEAIPQFEVGCPSFPGISVDACIQRGLKLAYSI